MQVNSIQNNSFKSGLTPQILKNEANVNPKKVENYFKNSPYNSNRYDFRNLDLKNNKAYALAFRMCAEIFKKFSRKHNYGGRQYLASQVFPSDIIVFDKEDLADNLSDAFMWSFHTVSCDISKHDSHFKNLKYTLGMGSILAPNVFDSLKKMNEYAEINSNRQNYYHSSSHFLNWCVHEWIHSISEYYLYRESAGFCGSNYEATVHHRQNAQLNNQEKQIVRDVLGEYAANAKTNQYDEIIAEAWTKFICSSLDKDSINFKKDPVDVMKKTPKEFRKILKKASTIHFYDYNYLKKETEPSSRSAMCFYPKV